MSLNRYNIKRLTLSALFASIILIFTAFIFHIPISSSGAYIHFGDVFIFLAATLLPYPDALFASAIGAGLADFMSGYPMWIPFTLVIKPIMVMCFTSHGSKILLSKRNLIAPFLSGAICLLGYYLAEVILYGNFISPLASIPGGIIQFGGSIVFYFIFAKMIDNRDLKGKLI